MISKLLDLDSKETWHADFEELVYGEAVWRRIETALHSPETQEIDFLSQVTCDSHCLSDELATFLRHRAREIFVLRYSHVVGYHGCRPK